MITPTQDPLFIAVKAFIMSLLPLDTDHVVQGLGNGVPMPDGAFICLTATALKRLSTNHANYSVDLQRSVTMPTEFSIQFDCYGPNAGDYANELVAMWRDEYACNILAPVAAPLYSSDPIQAPLVNGEENYEQRFTFTALLQFNPVITVPQQSATALAVELVSVDAEFPPTP